MMTPHNLNIVNNNSSISSSTSEPSNAPNLTK
jgi:hypothetical protein